MVIKDNDKQILIDRWYKSTLSKQKTLDFFNVLLFLVIEIKYQNLSVD